MKNIISYRIYNALRALGYGPMAAWRKAYQL